MGRDLCYRKDGGDTTWVSDGRPSVGWFLFALGWIEVSLAWLLNYARPAASPFDYIMLVILGPISCGLSWSGIPILGTRIVIGEGCISATSWLGRRRKYYSADTVSVIVDSGYEIRPFGIRFKRASSPYYLQLTVDGTRFVVYAPKRKGQSVWARAEHVARLFRESGFAGVEVVEKVVDADVKAVSRHGDGIEFRSTAWQRAGALLVFVIFLALAADLALALCFPEQFPTNDHFGLYTPLHRLQWGFVPMVMAAVGFYLYWTTARSFVRANPEFVEQSDGFRRVRIKWSEVASYSYEVPPGGGIAEPVLRDVSGRVTFRPWRHLVSSSDSLKSERLAFWDYAITHYFKVRPTGDQRSDDNVVA